MNEHTLTKASKRMGFNIKGLSIEEVYAMVEEQQRQYSKAEIVNGGLKKLDFIKGYTPYLASKGYGASERKEIIDREWNTLIGKRN